MIYLKVIFESMVYPSNMQHTREFVLKLAWFLNRYGCFAERLKRTCVSVKKMQQMRKLHMLYVLHKLKISSRAWMMGMNRILPKVVQTYLEDRNNVYPLRVRSSANRIYMYLMTVSLH